jgi:hypothetical protein
MMSSSTSEVPELSTQEEQRDDRSPEGALHARRTAQIPKTAFMSR